MITRITQHPPSSLYKRLNYAIFKKRAPFNWIHFFKFKIKVNCVTICNSILEFQQSADYVMCDFNRCVPKFTNYFVDVVETLTNFNITGCFI